MASPTPDELAEAAERLGWEAPIKPSEAAMRAVEEKYPEEGDAERYRLAQAEEMLLRYRVATRRGGTDG